MNPSLGNRFSQHSFAKTPSANTPRSKFDRSFAVKDTFKFDELTPIFWDAILPGDTINLNVQTFMRLAPQVVPMMENMYVDFYFFFVPDRLVYDNFQKLMGEQENPGDSIDFLMPILDTTASTTLSVNTIYDKFGLPTDVNIQNAPLIAAPFRAYNLIWNQWFRDQDLQNSVTVPKGNGPDSLATYTLLKGAKKHDYFTSARPYPQKGNNPTVMSITGTTPVVSTGATPQYRTAGDATDRPYQFYVNGGVRTMTYGGANIAGPTDSFFGTVTGLQADFTNVGSTANIAISAFRQAIQVQTFLERDSRNGTRYTEILKSHFNVISPDARLQRSEFLSGATINITQHPVPQTSETAGTSPQANLAAFSTATAMGKHIGFSKSFVEHGYVIGLAKARADVTYQQGINRMWQRRTRFDFFWPEFQELSEQTVYQREIFASSATINSIFGYQERYAEYRYRPSEIRGQFRSTYAQTLDVYHLAEKFASAPALNSAFIQSNTPIARALVATQTFQLLADYWFDYKHIRPMVTYPVPVGLGRF